MSDPKKWWLISDEVIQIIRKGLMAPTHGINEYNCATGFGNCSGCDGDKQRKNAVYALDTGLNTTDCIPDDWKKIKETMNDSS